MVEGHQCHRVAHFHRQKLIGKRFEASSPNGRFMDGAAAIHRRPLTRIEVHGKNLFYFFQNADDASSQQYVVHIHFGMSGAFSLYDLNIDGDGALGKEPTATTRLQLINQTEGIVAHLSAMTVQLGDLGMFCCFIMNV